MSLTTTIARGVVDRLAADPRRRSASRATNGSWQATRQDPETFLEGLKAQSAYVRSIRGKDIDLIVVPSFLRGMRRSGYVNTATAINELVDNSIQARAGSVHVVFGFETSSTKPTAIAVLDDGHGMEPLMLKVALAWGGTHREDSRAGFGRFGYGLPTACMSQGRRFSVYSKTSGRPTYRAVLDTEALERGHGSSNGQDVLRRPIVAKLPKWLVEYAAKSVPSILEEEGHGTVVLLEKLDNVSWKTAVALERNLDRSLGVTYRVFLRKIRIRVQGRRVRPIDPLFTTPNGRYYNLDSDRAEDVPWPPIPLTAGNGRPATIKVRAAYFPPTFPRADKARDAVGLNANPRFAVMKENNGVIVLRLGRQVDVVSTGLWTQIQNNDRYWAVELDFPAELDEWFDITTNKQRIALTPPVRDALRKGGVAELIENLRARYKHDRRLLAGVTSTRPTTRIQQDGGREASGVDEHPTVASLPGGAFYLVRDAGPTFVLNDQHPFFVKMYAGLAPEARGGIEAILSVLAQAERAADPDGKHFYRQERRKWSQLLEASCNIKGE